LKSDEPIILEALCHGDRGFITGPSKSGRTTLAAQLALAVAAGKGVLGFDVASPWRVTLVNTQSAAHHYNRRLDEIAAVMGLTSTHLDGRLKICNIRYQTAHPVDIAKEMMAHSPSLVVIDVIDAIADQIVKAHKRKGAALIAVCNNKKYSLQASDACWVIKPSTFRNTTKHALRFLTRHHPPRPTAYLEWVEGCFQARDATQIAGEYKDASRNFDGPYNI
jgi:hypothetical protein